MGIFLKKKMKKATIALVLMALLGEQAVEGVKLEMQVAGEPAAANVVKGDVEDKGIKEAEEHAADIAGAKKADEGMKAAEAKAAGEAAKATVDTAAAAKAAQEAEWAKLPAGPDGLQHWPDGRTFYVPHGQQVGGVNNYVQK